MPLQEKYLPNYTYDDYIKWEGRWELIEGIPYAMTAMASKNHQNINGKLLKAFLDELADCPECHPYMPVDVKINDHTVVQPDLSVFCGNTEDEDPSILPIMIAEIISLSSITMDTQIKYRMYEKSAIPFYLLINPDNQSFKLYSLADSRIYQLLLENSGEKGESIFNVPLTENCEVRIDTAEIL